MNTIYFERWDAVCSVCEAVTASVGHTGPRKASKAETGLYESLLPKRHKDCGGVTEAVYYCEEREQDREVPVLVTQQQRASGGGRKAVMEPCPNCGTELSARERRKACPKCGMTERDALKAALAAAAVATPRKGRKVKALVP